MEEKRPKQGTAELQLKKEKPGREKGAAGGFEKGHMTSSSSVKLCHRPGTGTTGLGTRKVRWHQGAHISGQQPGCSRAGHGPRMRSHPAQGQFPGAKAKGGSSYCLPGRRLGLAGSDERGKRGHDGKGHHGWLQQQADCWCSFPVGSLMSAFQNEPWIRALHCRCRHPKRHLNDTPNTEFLNNLLC